MSFLISEKSMVLRIPNLINIRVVHLQIFTPFLLLFTVTKCVFLAIYDVSVKIQKGTSASFESRQTILLRRGLRVPHRCTGCEGEIGIREVSGVEFEDEDHAIEWAMKNAN